MRVSGLQIGLALVGVGLYSLLALPSIRSSPALAADARMANLLVTNNDGNLEIQAVLIGAMPSSLIEELNTGMAATFRFYVELWEYRRFWADKRLATKVVERSVKYDVLTKEFRVIPTKGEEKEAFVSKDFWEVQRVASELRAVKMAPFSTLKGSDLYYVRIRGEVRPAHSDSALTKVIPFLSSRGTETPWESSPLLTISRNR